MSARPMDPTDADGAAETRRAVRNVLTLGGSLILTLGIAIAMRVLLPRHLGPERFGALTSADALTTAAFIVLELGADIYVRKHVSVRAGHASDFFGGVLALRVMAAALVTGAMALFMAITHRPAELRALVYLLSAAQLLIHMNATLSALLHAKGEVSAMSALSVVAKLVWAAMTLAAVLAAAPLWTFALAALASESLRSVVLLGLARRHLGLIVRLDPRATRLMVVSSLPYYLNTFATTAYGKLDITLLSLRAGTREVGWYAAAAAVAGLTLLLAPLLGWVLMPTFARAAAQSRDALLSRIRGATMQVLTLAIPASFLVALGADRWVSMLFGAAFAPAALSLRILAVTFVLTYLNILYAITLTILDRPWTLTLISGCGLVVNVALNLGLVPQTLRLLGDGGGGAGCAMATLGTELFVTTAMLTVVGREAFDRDTAIMVAKHLAATAAALGLGQVTGATGMARLLIVSGAYVALVMGTGAVRLGTMTSAVVDAVRARSPLSAQRR